MCGRLDHNEKDCDEFVRFKKASKKILKEYDPWMRAEGPTMFRTTENGHGHGVTDESLSNQKRQSDYRRNLLNAPDRIQPRSPEVKCNKGKGILDNQRKSVDEPVPVSKGSTQDKAHIRGFEYGLENIADLVGGDLAGNKDREDAFQKQDNSDGLNSRRAPLVDILNVAKPKQIHATKSPST